MNDFPMIYAISVLLLGAGMTLAFFSFLRMIFAIFNRKREASTLGLFVFCVLGCLVAMAAWHALAVQGYAPFLAEQSSLYLGTLTNAWQSLDAYYQQRLVLLMLLLAWLDAERRSSLGYRVFKGEITSWFMGLMDGIHRRRKRLGRKIEAAFNRLMERAVNAYMAHVHLMMNFKGRS